MSGGVLVRVVFVQMVFVWGGFCPTPKFDGEKKRKLLKHLPSCLAERDALHPNSK